MNVDSSSSHASEAHECFGIGAPVYRLATPPRTKKKKKTFVANVAKKKKIVCVC